MTETTTMRIFEENVSLLDTVTINAEGRIKYDDGTLTALYPVDAKATQYVLSKYQYDSEREKPSADLSKNSVVLEIGGGELIVLTPVSCYGEK